MKYSTTRPQYKLFFFCLSQNNFLKSRVFIRATKEKVNENHWHWCHKILQMTFFSLLSSSNKSPSPQLCLVPAYVSPNKTISMTLCHWKSKYVLLWFRSIDPLSCSYSEDFGYAFAFSQVYLKPWFLCPTIMENGPWTIYYVMVLVYYLSLSFAYALSVIHTNTHTRTNTHTPLHCQ